MGLSLPIPIRECVHVVGSANPISIPYLTVSDWLRFLLVQAPCLIAGGRDSLELQLSSFWKMYEWAHPSHEVFSHDPSVLSRTIPLNLWGDEGKGPKRGNYMVGTWESPLGVYEHKAAECSCSKFVAETPQEFIPDCYGSAVSATDMNVQIARKMSTNYKGHSYLTRHFLYGLPDVIYKDFPEALEHVLDLLAKELVALFHSGLQVGQHTWHVALIGHKGDLKHFAEKVAHLTRSYAHMGRVSSRMMCSHCEAGKVGLPWDELSHRPKWVQTQYMSRPWAKTPPLTVVPFEVAAPEKLYRLDVFHLVKLGVARDLAGCIFLLAKLGFWDAPGDSLAMKQRLFRAHVQLKLWASAEGASLALRYFSLRLFSVKRLSDHPWTNTKASDTVILLRFLKWFANLHLESPTPTSAPHRKLLKLLSKTTAHCLEILRVCSSHGLFMDRACGQYLYTCFMRFLSGYQALARAVLDMNEAACSLKPKFHGVAHLANDLREVLHTRAPLIMNPYIFGCDVNEDTVKHICNLAVKVAPKTITRRVIQRSFLKKAAVMRRHLRYRAQGFTTN